MKKNIWYFYRKAIDWMKDYGLPTLTILGPIVYMVIYDVKPWDTFSDIRDKHKQVHFHNDMGKAMLKSGFYAKAKEEYERALSLNPTSFEGQKGRYLADMFMDFDSATWNPAIGMGIWRRLDSSGAGKDPGYREILVKYQGDLYQRIGDYSRAESLYDAAINADPDYLDALFSKGWLNYGSYPKPKLREMTEAFRQMASRNSFDYRGFHGYGYALYMRAVGRFPGKGDPKLLIDAKNQCARAKNVSINELNVLMDFGEIARTIDPRLSLIFHSEAQKLLSDPVRSALRDNSMPLQSCLLAIDSGCVGLESPKKKSAWIRYQLSLDYAAIHRMEADSAGTCAKMGDSLYAQAQALDTGNQVYPIYLDQLQILTQFVPPKPHEVQ
jgi:tetratricopeptide (TPR) repeat protein